MAQQVKNSPANAGDAGLIPGLGRSPEGGNGSPLQDSCLENLMDGGAWWAIAHEVTKSWMQLSTHAQHYICEYIPKHYSCRLQNNLVNHFNDGSMPPFFRKCLLNGEYFT